MKIKVGTLKSIPFLYCIFYSLTRAFLGALFGQIPYMLLLGFLGIQIFIYFLFYKSQIQKITRTGFYAGFFAYLIFLAVNLAVCQHAYTYALYEYFFYLLSFFAVCHVLCNIDFKTILHFYEFVGFILSVEAIFEYVTGKMPFRAATTEQDIRRACGLIGNPLTLGAMFSCIALIAFYMAKQKERAPLHYGVFAFCVIGLLATQSRGPFVAFAVAFIVMMSLMEYKRSKSFINATVKNLLIVIAVVLVLYVLMVFLNGKVPFVTAIYSRVQSILMWGGEDYSNTLRRERWEYGLQLFRENPILGYGVSSTGNHSVTGINVESGVIKKLAETGLIGFLLYYLTFGATIFVSMKRCIKGDAMHYPIAFSVIIAIFIENISLQNIESLSVFLLFIICFTYLFMQGNVCMKNQLRS